MKMTENNHDRTVVLDMGKAEGGFFADNIVTIAHIVTNIVANIVTIISPHLTAIK